MQIRLWGWFNQSFYYLGWSLCGGHPYSWSCFSHFPPTDTSPQTTTFNSMLQLLLLSEPWTLHKDCSATLLQVLVNSHPNWEVWLENYNEKSTALGVWAMGLTFGYPDCVCFLSIKKDKYLLILPLWDKTCISILRSHKDWIFYGATLSGLLSTLHQNNTPHLSGAGGDCKNAIFPWHLPPSRRSHHYSSTGCWLLKTLSKYHDS